MYAEGAEPPINPSTHTKFFKTDRLEVFTLFPFTSLLTTPKLTTAAAPVKTLSAQS